jgi:transcriptional regulator with XRE-family HTH domain
MGNKPKYQQEDVLKELYWEQELTLEQIGNKFGVDMTTIRNWMEKHGINRRYSGTLQERFEQYYEIDEGSGCWIWQNEPDERGYGKIWDSDKGGHRMAHRVAFDLYRDEELPEFSPDEQVNHTCHNPACVNPDHLYIGTQKENMQDALNVEAWGDDRPRGSDVGNSKLTEEHVVEIKERCIAGETQKEVAKDYPASHTMVNKIMIGEWWNHVGPDMSEVDYNAPEATGESHGKSKLSPDDVREIRRLSDTGMTYDEIAERVSVGTTAIGQIIRGETWQHVE